MKKILRFILLCVGWFFLALSPGETVDGSMVPNLCCMVVSAWAFIIGGIYLNENR